MANWLDVGGNSDQDQDPEFLNQEQDMDPVKKNLYCPEWLISLSVEDISSLNS